MVFNKFSQYEMQRNMKKPRNLEKDNRQHVEYYKDYFGHKEKSLYLLSGYKPKSDVSGETWTIFPEALPSVPLTAVIRLIMIDLCYKVYAEMHCIFVAEIKGGAEGPSKQGYTEL